MRENWPPPIRPGCLKERQNDELSPRSISFWKRPSKCNTSHVGMKLRPKLLQDIINRTLQAKLSGMNSVKAIFDLDSTLFDVSFRISKILHTFAELPEMKSKYPSEMEAIKKITPHNQDYGVKRTLQRLGFCSPGEDFTISLIEFWKKNFFGNDYLHYDLPYPGAPEYVQDLYKAGADIFYLTGRDIPRMWDGTIKSLVAHGFPLNSDHANLILKPSSVQRDTEFKREFFKNMKKSEADVWFFENEPTNIHVVLETSPHIKIVFVETVHSQSGPLPGDHIPKVSGFITEDKS